MQDFSPHHPIVQNSHGNHCKSLSQRRYGWYHLARVSYLRQYIHHYIDVRPPRRSATDWEKTGDVLASTTLDGPPLGSSTNRSSCYPEHPFLASVLYFFGIISIFLLLLDFLDWQPRILTTDTYQHISIFLVSGFGYFFISISYSWSPLLHNFHQALYQQIPTTVYWMSIWATHSHNRCLASISFFSNLYNMDKSEFLPSLGTIIAAQIPSNSVVNIMKLSIFSFIGLLTIVCVCYISIKSRFWLHEPQSSRVSLLCDLCISQMLEPNDYYQALDFIRISHRHNLDPSSTSFFSLFLFPGQHQKRQS